MKLLPCREKCGTYALNPPTQLHPKGTPAIAGHITTNPYVIKCSRCGRSTRLTFVEFNALPEMTLEDFYRLGFPDMPTQDLQGFGMKREEAKDLFRQGWTVDDLHVLSRGQEDLLFANEQLDALRENEARA